MPGMVFNGAPSIGFLTTSVNRLPNATGASKGSSLGQVRVVPVAKRQLNEYHLLGLIEHVWRDNENDVPRWSKN